MPDLTHTALGAWSGGRFMHYGEQLDEQRLVEILRPGDGIDTVLTADVYGAGQADELVGRALKGVDRERYRLVGSIGHDFYKGLRQGAKGFPRFTDAALRPESEFARYIRMATEASLQRCGVDRFDLLLLHNPDRTGFTSSAVWDGMAAVRDAGLTDMIGVAPGPANGYTLDVIDCFERFGDLIDWAMVILGPLEPWPGSLVLPAAVRHDVRLLTRVVDYGGVFHGDVRPGQVFAERDHRGFRPAGWVEEGYAKLERILPIAEQHGLTPLQLACQWTLAQPAVQSVVPTLIQELGAGARSIESKRADLAAVPREIVLSDAEIDEIRALGDNTGCMVLKGGSAAYTDEPIADRWPLDQDLAQLAERWSIDPVQALAYDHANV